MAEETMYPILVFKEYLLFPRQISLINLGTVRDKKNASGKSRADYFPVGGFVVCALKADKIGQGVRVVSPHDPFYEDGVLAQILEVGETEQKKIQMKLQGLSRVKIIHAVSGSKERLALAVSLPMATRVAVVGVAPHEAVSSDSLYRLSELIQDFLVDHEGEISSEKAAQVYELPAKIETLRIKNGKNQRIEDPEFFLEMRSALYFLAVTYLSKFFAISDIHTVLASPDIESEVAAWIALFVKQPGTSDLVGTQKPSYKERYSQKQASMHPELASRVLTEMTRLESSSDKMHGSEISVIENWLDFVLGLPFGIKTEDNQDLENAESVLEEEHYGLEKVKRRIVEILAVRKQNPKAKGSIICFVGPPGVGKTSLGKCIAKALGRKFIKRSVSGVRDEAEIRGHRRTYVGALPGMFLKEIRKAGSMNPVYMVDEIDKMERDSRGDPAAALLEVMDPEQNAGFHDHYLDEPFDLSEVFFVCTANVRERIPATLADRMEIITVPGYSEREKLEIAKRHLVQRQARDHGLQDAVEVIFSDDILKKIIMEYTFESGVRSLGRELATIFRKVTYNHQRGIDTSTKIEVTTELVGSMLGKPKMEFRKRYQTLAGEAVGMAVYGEKGSGCIMPSQCIIVPGKHHKELSQPGRMGEIMKNATKNALSRARIYIHEHNPALSDAIDNGLIQVLFPDDDSGLDGPSAGVATCVAILSRIYNKPVKQGLAMTGKLDALGRVIAVGGIKEKILAAERAGIYEVMIPKLNEKDLDDLHHDDKANMKIHLIETIDEAVGIAFEGRIGRESIECTVL